MATTETAVEADQEAHRNENVAEEQTHILSVEPNGINASSACVIESPCSKEDKVDNLSANTHRGQVHHAHDELELFDGCSNETNEADCSTDQVHPEAPNNESFPSKCNINANRIIIITISVVTAVSCIVYNVGNLSAKEHAIDKVDQTIEEEWANHLLDFLFFESHHLCGSVLSGDSLFLNTNLLLLLLHDKVRVSILSLLNKRFLISLPIWLLVRLLVWLLVWLLLILRLLLRLGCWVFERRKLTFRNRRSNKLHLSAVWVVLHRCTVRIVHGLCSISISERNRCTIWVVSQGRAVRIVLLRCFRRIGERNHRTIRVVLHG